MVLNTTISPTKPSFGLKWHEGAVFCCPKTIPTHRIPSISKTQAFKFLENIFIYNDCLISFNISGAFFEPILEAFSNELIAPGLFPTAN